VPLDTDIEPIVIGAAGVPVAIQPAADRQLAVAGARARRS
jgi:hypothetical protein